MYKGLSTKAITDFAEQEKLNELRKIVLSMPVNNINNLTEIFLAKNVKELKKLINKQIKNNQI